MQTDDIAAWLTQILDEDEAVADGLMTKYGCSPARWGMGDKIPGTDQHIIVSEWTRADGSTARESIGIAASRELVLRLTFRDPASALARIAADRQILATYLAYRDAPERMTDVRADSWWRALDEVVRLLALPHADRPGYQEAWRPARLL